MNSEEHSSFFIINSSLNKMDTIELQQTLPEVFAGRDGIVSDVWHRQVAFQKGKMYLIEAASGTGKSSLCSFIYGYRTDYQGIITFDGENVRKLTVKQWTDIRKRSLGMLFQELRLFGELTAWENVQLKNGLTGFCRKQQVKDWFEQLGIADKWDVKAARMSYGQQQRVAFVRMLCQPADFFFLDEPVSHLDDGNGQIMARILKEEAARQGAGVIVTSIGTAGRILPGQLVRYGDCAFGHTVLQGRVAGVYAGRQFHEEGLRDCEQAGEHAGQPGGQGRYVLACRHSRHGVAAVCQADGSVHSGTVSGVGRHGHGGYAALYGDVL